MNICTNCNKEFLKHRKSKGVYCSQKCFREHKKSESLTELICTFCKGKFDRVKRLVKDKEAFCSVEHSNLHRYGFTSYGWKEIQKRYDEGLSYRGLQEEFGCVSATITKAVKRGDLITRTRSEALKLEAKKNPKKHSEETKKKISEIRIKFLQENPDKVPYLINHSSKKSYPEEIFEKALVNSGISNYVYNFRNGIYQYDFAFPELKIDVEIDGGTHLTEKVKKIDLRRDEWSKEQGWTVVRFTAKQVKEDVVSCVGLIKNLLTNSAKDVQ